MSSSVHAKSGPVLPNPVMTSSATKRMPYAWQRARIAFIQPHLDVGTRTLRVRFDLRNTHAHELRPGMYATVKLQMPVTQTSAFTNAIREDLWQGNLAEAVARLASGPAALAPDFGVQSLLFAAGKLALTARGTVLAVPESAVIDTGGRKIVYRQVRGRGTRRCFCE